MASRSAPKNSPAPRRRWAGITARSRFPTTCWQAWRNVGKQGASANADWRSRFEAKPEAQRSEFTAPRDRPQAPARTRRRHPQAQGKARRRAADGRHPQGERDGARGAGARDAGTAARLGRPHAVQQHPHQGPEGSDAGRFQRPLHPLRHPRDGHGGGHERHLGPWRLCAGGRHLPVLHRLCAALDADRGAVAYARWSTS